MFDSTVAHFQVIRTALEPETTPVALKARPGVVRQKTPGYNSKAIEKIKYKIQKIFFS